MGVSHYNHMRNLGIPESQYGLNGESELRDDMWLDVVDILQGFGVSDRAFLK